MKCSRCGAKCRVTVTVAEPKTSSTWSFCPFHAERIRYILRCSPKRRTTPRRGTHDPAQSGLRIPVRPRYNPSTCGRSG